MAIITSSFSHFAIRRHPDPWLPTIQSTLTHPDDLPKLQRALAEYSSHFGSTPGYFCGAELKDAELIGGTICESGWVDCWVGLGKENLQGHGH